MAVNEVEKEELVIEFQTTRDSYSMWTETGMRCDIMKCHTQHLGSGDPENYPSYMWVKSLQGYFVMRQEIKDNKAGNWIILREIQPDDPGRYFFEEFADNFEAYVRAIEEKVSQAPSSEAEAP